MEEETEILVDRSEKVQVVYDKDKDKIIVTGSTFKVSVTISMDQLTDLYLGGKGGGRARVTVNK
jgi:hypothetical protein